MKHVTVYTCIYVTFILMYHRSLKQFNLVLRMYVTIMPIGRKALGNKELELELGQCTHMESLGQLLIKYPDRVHLGCCLD